MPIPANVETTPEGLQAGLRKISSDVIPDIGLATTQVALEDLFMGVVRRAPKGSVKTSPHPGKLRASVKASRGKAAFADLPDALSYPTPGITEVVGVSGALELGEDAFVTDDAKTDGQGSYAPSIEAGLRTGPAKRKGKLLSRTSIRHAQKTKKTGSASRRYGSPQAPGGFFKPAVADLVSDAAQVMRRGIERALRRRNL